MPRPHYALAALILLAWTTAIQGQTALTPQAGLLVLRNGQVLEGQITRAGDYYVVTFSGASEVRLRAAEVEAVCGSLDEAYEFKAGHLSGSGARPHLELAEWCLRHSLHAPCAEQLVAAMRLEPESSALKLLERRLELAVESPLPTIAAAMPSTVTVSAEQLEKAIRALPRGSIEKFSAIVQPILLNRCGANQCHGPNAKSDFTLLRPAAGQVASRRFTQRNLFATLQYLDASNPDASPLLTMPQRRHGTSLTAVFDKQSLKQLDELTAWVRLTSAASPSTGIPSIAKSTTTLSQSAAKDSTPTSEPEASSAEPPDQSPGAQGVRAMKPAVDSAGDAEGQRHAITADERFVPRDRFDPEIFNRRFLPK